MNKYAAQTSVSSENSRNEIERTLKRYGATQFAYGWKERDAAIGFAMKGKQIRFILPLPDRTDKEFTRTEARGSVRSPEAQERVYEQAVRQRWRALALVVKAKLEAVESGIAIFEEEFLANIVLPGGQTVGQFMLPQVAEVYKTGRLPQMLPMLEVKGGEE